MKGKYYWIAAAIIVSIPMAWVYSRLDFLHYMEEYIYFSYQGASHRKQINYVEICKTESYYAEEVIDSLKASKYDVVYFINLPRKNSNAELPDNFTEAYDLVDYIQYSYYGNLFINVDKALLYKFPTLFADDFNEVDSKLYLNYAGQVENFTAVNSILELQHSYVDSIKFIVIGYAGSSFYPSLSNDTIEVWQTPIGEMYDTVLKANLLADINENTFYRKLNFGYTVVLGLITFVILVSIILLFRKKQQLVYRLFQLVLCTLAILSSLFSLINFHIILPLGFIAFNIVVWGELAYRIQIVEPAEQDN